MLKSNGHGAKGREGQVGVEELGLGDEKLDQATSRRKRRKKKLMAMISMLMVDLFLLGLIVLLCMFFLWIERGREEKGKCWILGLVPI